MSPSHSRGLRNRNSWRGDSRQFLASLLLFAHTLNLISKSSQWPIPRMCRGFWRSTSYEWNTGNWISRRNITGSRPRYWNKSCVFHIIRRPNLLVQWPDPLHSISAWYPWGTTRDQVRLQEVLPTHHFHVGRIKYTGRWCPGHGLDGLLNVVLIAQQPKWVNAESTI